MLSLYEGWLIFYNCFLEHITKSFLCIEEFALMHAPTQYDDLNECGLLLIVTER